MSLNGLLNQQVTITNRTGYSADGRQVLGGATTVNARFQRTTKQRLAPNNSLTVIEAVVYVPASTTVSVNDKVTYDGADYKVFGRYDAVGMSGDINHIKLELTKWLT